ncbi:MAG TPA: PilZ domain-containing protein [Terriglobales bacterium]|nr:PilZ domain-containing protein [Terriglobales bacterium]
MAIGFAGIAQSKKVSARAALVNLDSKSAGILRDCFRQFGIGTEVLSAGEAERLHREKFDACAVGIDEKAGEVLQAARESKYNRRMMIFAVCANLGEVVRLSRYGLNVLLEKPVERQAALRAVKSTHLLILHEFRRYVRIPVIVKVEARLATRKIQASTVEVSGGGMSLRHEGKFLLGEEAHLKFDLPGKAGLSCRAEVSWVDAEQQMAGLRFDINDDGRLSVKQWIEDYLEIT